MNIKNSGKTQSSPKVIFPTEIFKQLLLRNFGKNQLLVLMHVARYQFGFNVLKLCLAKRGEFTYIGLDKSTVSNEIKKLLGAGVLLETDGSFKINRDTEKWQVPMKSNVDILRLKGMDTVHVAAQAELIENQQKNHT